ncbi:MAG: permease [Spirochaetes bacterium GWD1_61_31]|nr:MAG: permease [Spirochaetes bacterium GWB1_60_80]OHD35546.1 MAG: permease [Spirochaetes bacterium GWD1_61_31]OHD57923.1 MAG: permease [Spirochaetes bacterium GWF1_60_12]
METILLYGIAALALFFSLIKDKQKTKTALKKAWKAFEGILPQFINVLFFVATVLAIVDTATISRVLGSGSGFLGIIGASLIGAITLIPGFVAFPAAAALLHNGAGATQVAAFVSSLMMVGVVTLPMEIKYFGKRVAILRNVLAWLFSILAAFFVGWVVML